MTEENKTPDNNKAKYFQNVFALPKQRRMAFVSVCFAFVFSLFFLMPLDLYLNNFIEFNISAGHVALPLLTTGIMIFIPVILVFPLIFRWKALDIVTLLLCGALVASYIQVLFLNGEMGLLTGARTGHSTDLSNSTSRLAFFIIIFIPLCVWKWIEDGKNHKNVKWGTGMLCVSVVILGMQTAGLIAAIPGYDSKFVRGPGYLSYDKAFQLSSKKNICVFITDTLDVKYMTETLEKYPELNEQLDGFKFYKNNVSTHCFTFPSITQMITGEIFNNRDSVPDYLEKAWAGRNIIDILRENGYNTTLLLGKLSTFRRFSHLNNRADNLTALKESDVRIKHPEIVKTTLNISFGRAAPSFFKDIFFTRFDAGFSNEFFEWPDDVLTPAINNSADINYYNRLKTTGLYIQDERNTFTVAHLNCAHDGGYRYNQETDTVEFYKGGDSIRGCFAILNEYFTQMKKLDVYDNSTIIIVADHGSRPLRLQEMDLTGEITSTLMIKPENARGNLKTDTSSELSHVNFRSGILQIAGLPREDFGLSYFDIIDGQLPQTRELSSGYKFGVINKNGKYRITGDPNDLRLIGKYEIKGDANDFSNWTFELRIEE